MNAVTFKKSGPLYLLHKTMFKNDPADTCAYKRELIISSIVFLVTLHASLIRTIIWAFPSTRDDETLYGINLQLILIGLSIISLMVGTNLIEDGYIFYDFIFWSELSPIMFYLNSFVALGIGLITITLGLVVIGLICYIIFLIYKGGEIGVNAIRDVAPPLTNDEGEPTTQIGMVYKSAKERWCKKIKWEN